MTVPAGERVTRVVDAMTLAGLVTLCDGLLGNEEHDDNGADADVAPTQCTELHDVSPRQD
ncbi:hypothetical protein LMG31884_25400 [Xanthomonas hydrangeae]|nr:hypothetical protein LMG31884_25400 [Xanthomonas hydrangeae]CAD7717290.1 hypothetical protein LMG31884_25400 [Xanthomonas hydrangeae]CAD7733816.1 hypothetical protein LMG31887_25280 [Xanthomonas hydrangeae]CAD7733819.1 hypothetical protein LMG31887_25280 [Xanthomonas hydrangeae]